MDHEIVLNKCYSGFELSPKAMEMIAKKKGLTYFIYKFDKDKFVKINTVEKNWPEDSYYYITSKDFGDEVGLKDISSNLEDYFLNIARHDKDLVSTVKELGRESFGYSSVLEIEKTTSKLYKIDNWDGYERLVVPEDVDWCIIEEDA